MSVVYFLRVMPDGPIKIGTTGGCVTSRMRSLQQSSPHVLKWVGYFPGGKTEEQEAHRLLSGSRMRGEWFYPTCEVLEFVESRCPLFDEDQAIEQLFSLPLMAKLREYLPPHRSAREGRFYAFCRAVDILPYELAAWLDRRRRLSDEQLREVLSFLGKSEAAA